MVYSEFSGKVGDIVSGVVQRVERKSVMVDLGTVEAMLMPQEQVESDNYHPNQRLKIYIVDVQRTTKGPQIIISRTHAGLVKGKLLSLRFRKFRQALLRLRAFREKRAHARKIAVVSNDENVDPIGAHASAQKGPVLQILLTS